MTCYSACSIELRLAGAEYVEAPVEDAVVDGNIITGVAWPSNPFVLKRFSELLNVTITHNQWWNKDVKEPEGDKFNGNSVVSIS